MLRYRHTGLLVIIILLFSTLVPAAASASPATESDFVSRVNATRAQAGLPPLAVDGQLTSLSRGWAEQMRSGVCGAGNFICHANPISAGVTHNWAKLGENVGTGPNTSLVMDAFIASPGHYANIVDPQFTHIGVGVVWEGDRLFTVHRFMRLQDAPPPTTTTPPTTAAPTTTVPPTTAPPTTAAPTTAAPRVTAPPTTTAPGVIAPPTTNAPAIPIGPSTGGANELLETLQPNDVVGDDDLDSAQDPDLGASSTSERAQIIADALIDLR